jgi:nucleotide-binding universal stress UspA family protein
MEQEKQKIVVPWDFTNVAENAMMHAVKISRMVNSSIILLHIIDRDIKTADYKKKEDQLKKYCVDAAQRNDAEFDYVLIPGSIFTAIAEYVNENEANLVVMGTHGMKGMQKFTGSWALKVVIGSKVPFIIVQEAPKDLEKYHDIVFPVDFRGENKEKLKMAIFMGKYFDSKVNILKAQTTDKSLLKKTNINLNFAIKYLIQNNIEYKIHDLPKGNLAKQTIEFANSINADLILIMTTKNITVADYMLGAQEQYIIGNSSKIPVCCMNPRANFAKVSQFMYG